MVAGWLQAGCRLLCCALRACVRVCVCVCEREREWVAGSLAEHSVRARVRARACVCQRERDPKGTFGGKARGVRRNGAKARLKP